MTSSDPGIYLERIDSGRNMARFYALEIEADLFGHVLAVRRWGRIGTTGRQQSLPCPSRDLAIAEVERLRDVKIGRGYRQKRLV
ncbi:WGR domain-containing protein [Rhizobium sp. LjRoot254]|uniref:WGR domain-containing protein n=1 Tax=Rhizobium sp. LjRoot254 TaxID=3342297 RepID=UPI003ECE27CE